MIGDEARDDLLQRLRAPPGPLRQRSQQRVDLGRQQPGNEPVDAPCIDLVDGIQRHREGDAVVGATRFEPIVQREPHAVHLQLAREAVAVDVVRLARSSASREIEGVPIAVVPEPVSSCRAQVTPGGMRASNQANSGLVVDQQVGCRAWCSSRSISAITRDCGG